MILRIEMDGLNDMIEAYLFDFLKAKGYDEGLADELAEELTDIAMDTLITELNAE